MALTFARPRLMRWSNNAITDHNRSALNVSVERIESKQRMANGTMRKYVVADKHTFSCSWEMIPATNDKTVDGFFGGASIENFYNTTPGSFTLELTDGASAVTTFTVMFSEFSKSIEKRGSVDYWNLDVTLEEV